MDQRNRPRRGIAPLEFVMALPFLVILAGILFTVTRASLARADATLQARNQAWHSRSGGGGGSLGGAGAASILGVLPGTSASSGLQSGSGSRSDKVEKLAPASQYFFFGTVNASAQHQVFSGPWDHETIAYRHEPPMGLDSRVFVLAAGAAAPATDALNLFSGLMNGVQPAHDAITAWNKVNNALNTVSNKLTELDREIREAEERLRDLRERLRVATDNAVIRELERQIEREEALLRKLREAREKLVKGQKLMPH